MPLIDADTPTADFAFAEAATPPISPITPPSAATPLARRFACACFRFRRLAALPRLRSYRPLLITLIFAAAILPPAPPDADADCLEPFRAPADAAVH